MAAAAGRRDSYELTWVPTPDQAACAAYVSAAAAAHAAGTALAFATCDATTGAVVGSTRFMNAERWRWPAWAPEPAGLARSSGPEAVEIGSTWLAAAAQRTGINTEAKLLMLSHAFEVWGSFRVCFKTDERNRRSRDNIERVGARFEGVLRNQIHATSGRPRDTALYALTDEDWPAAKAALAARLR